MAYKAEQLPKGRNGHAPGVARQAKKERARTIRRGGKRVTEDAPTRDVRRYGGWAD